MHNGEPLTHVEDDQYVALMGPPKILTVTFKTHLYLKGALLTKHGSHYLSDLIFESRLSLAHT